MLALDVRQHKLVRWPWKPPPGLPCVGNLCIKDGPPGGTLAEAHAMRFVSQHTSIPVPEVRCAFVRKGRPYIVMSRIHGQMAGYGWTRRSEASKERILAQLSNMVAKLRAVPSPKDAVVGNVLGGPLYDPRLPSRSFWGPYATTRAFHQALVGDMDINTDYAGLPEGVPDLLEFYRRAGDDYPLTLTHGDLSSLNVLVRGDDVVGIVDWETAGWFPSYWEYTCARNVNPHNLFWADEVDRFMDPMPRELEADRVRFRYFGPF